MLTAKTDQTDLSSSNRKQIISHALACSHSFCFDTVLMAFAEPMLALMQFDSTLIL